MRGHRTWRRAARRRSARANAMPSRVASQDRLSPEWSADRAAACRAGKVERQRAFLRTALLETLLHDYVFTGLAGTLLRTGPSSLPSASLPAHPLPDVRRAMQQLDALRFAGDEEAHDPDVHQRDLVQVEDEPEAVPPDFGPELVQGLRLDAADEPQRRGLAVGDRLDPKSH